MSAVTFACPGCGADLDETGEATMLDAVPAPHDPQGKARLQIAIRCDECGGDVYAFISRDDLCDANGNPIPAPRQ